jgi:cytochrome P450
MTIKENAPDKTDVVARLLAAFDHWDLELAQDPFPVYDALREQCPVAHSGRYGGFFVLSRFADIENTARDHETFSSHSLSVPPIDVNAAENRNPPLDLDPPRHTAFRQALLPYFSPGRTNQLEEVTRSTAARLAQALAGRGQADVAQDYAKHIPIAVLAQVLGVEPKHEDLFSEWTDAIVSGGGIDLQASTQANIDIRRYFADLIEQRRAEPRDDLVSLLTAATVDGQPISERDQLGAAALLLIAGIDTTWSMLGNSLWYLAQDDEARQLLAREPSLLPIAIEELLRRFAPVSVVRITTCPIEVGGHTIPEGTHVLLPFAAANLDPAAFPDPYRMQLNRAPNRHLAFGAGVHRCVGAHLARMELRVGLEEFLRQIPDFRLAGSDAVVWKPGQIRGPSRLVLAFGQQEDS